MNHGGTYRAPGHTVGDGRYRLDRLDTAAVTGSQVASWFAVDTWSARPVRLHLANPPVNLPATDHAGWLERATDGARRFAQLSSHPSLLVLGDAGQDGGQLWTVLDSTSARSLGDTVRAAGPVPPEQLRAMLRSLLDGLRALHDLGLVHGAITPDSVLFTGDGRAVLGCAGLPADGVPAAASASTSARLLAYQAPERLAGGPGEPAGDVFSLGAVAYFAAEGRGPFDRGDDVAATRYSVMYQPLAPPERAAALTGPIMAMLSQQPTDRPTAAGASALLAAPPAPSGPAGQVGAVDAGSATVHGLPPYSSPTGYAAPPGNAGPPGYSPQPGQYPPGGPPPPRAKRSRAPWYVGAAVAVLLLAGSVTALVLSSSDSSPDRNATGGSPTAGTLPTTSASASSAPPSPTPTRTRPPLPTRTPTPTPSSQPGADDYDPELREGFLESCSSASGGQDEVCECVIEEFETRYTQDEFIELNLDPDSTEAQEALASIIVLCGSTTDA